MLRRPTWRTAIPRPDPEQRERNKQNNDGKRLPKGSRFAKFEACMAGEFRYVLSTASGPCGAIVPASDLEALDSGGAAKKLETRLGWDLDARPGRIDDGARCVCEAIGSAWSTVIEMKRKGGCRVLLEYEGEPAVIVVDLEDLAQLEQRRAAAPALPSPRPPTPARKLSKGEADRAREVLEAFDLDELLEAHDETAKALRAIAAARGAGAIE